MRSGGVASVLLLTVCLSAQRTSTQRCLEYLTIETWVEDIFEPQWNLTEELRQMFPTLNPTKHMNKTIVLVLANNTEDVAKCTAWRLCKRNQSTCYLLRDCFKSKSTDPDLSGQCQTKQFAIVHTFHFMCLVARAVSLHTQVRGCEHEHVCPVIRKKDDAKIPKPAMVVAMTTKGGSSAATPTTPTTPTTTGVTTTCAATAGATATSATTLQQSLPPSQQGKALEISHTCSCE
ncbi:uncharacterized protein LOC128750761 [Synchiropus splendidus]|uniref:uncharacterized protein LOC128750761 n=1 Tax=Synchiropus splendidus TaxID=270530 RepID=UPI00237D6C84|nr:uncharacterized protein LOC128750761 [Synchiropus splendidus]XP_053707208.1 uncharacterized protein LOC128750761 [Synchiropus splendidus]XP_053707210.1 uncharacterized protein LOC128750761 [Synchiropus splendidus]